MNRTIEMFFPPKRQTIIAVLVTIATSAISTQAMALQSSEFERRAAAMQRARARSSQPVVVKATTAEPARSTAKVVKKASKSVRTASRSNSRAAESRNINPRPNERVASRVVSSQRAVVARQKPTRVAQLGPGGSGTRSGIVGSTFAGEEIVSGGPVYENVVQGNVVQGGVVQDNVIYDNGTFDNGTFDNGVYDNVVYDDGYYGDSCGCNSCSSGTCGAGPGDCCGRGGCPDTGRPYWLANLGNALYNGEYFGGAVGFQSPLFTAPGQDLPINENELASDSSFGFYGGFNLGIPLCRLSGGYLSGQFGVRSVNTNFNGNEFTSEERRQTFITTGLYRRVDYGLQFGAVADILHEEWFTESDLVQIRADIGWVYHGGHTFGFRYTTGVQDDESDGTFNNNQFFNFFQTVDDNYRFYYRQVAPWGGWGEAFIGWAEASQTIIGVDVDLPVTDSVSFQSGFTAVLNDDLVPAGGNFQGGNLNEAWNLFVGISYKPSGRSWYRSYDRPLFSVADNGTFLVRRQSPEIQ